VSRKRKKKALPSILEHEEEQEKMRMVVSGGNLEMEIKDLTIVLPKPIYQQIIHYTMATEDEISCLGMCRWDNKEIRVYELFLPKQVNSTGSTLLDEDEAAKILTNLIRAGRNPAELRLWFHSHGNMGVFWSGTDDDCCKTLGVTDFSVSIVGNRKKKLLGRVDIYKPFHLTISGVDIAVEDEVDFTIPQRIKDEVDEKVEKKTYWTRKEYDGYSNGQYCTPTYSKKGGLERKFNWVEKVWEVYDKEKKAWVEEDEYYRNLLTAENETIAGEWDGEQVALKDGSTFCPKTDKRKFGDVPPTVMFDICMETGDICLKCVYRTECDAYFTGTLKV